MHGPLYRRQSWRTRPLDESAPTDLPCHPRDVIPNDVLGHCSDARALDHMPLTSADLLEPSPSSFHSYSHDGLYMQSPACTRNIRYSDCIYGAIAASTITPLSICVQLNDAIGPLQAVCSIEAWRYMVDSRADGRIIPSCGLNTIPAAPHVIVPRPSKANGQRSIRARCRSRRGFRYPHFSECFSCRLPLSLGLGASFRMDVTPHVRTRPCD
ncbi:hypothetical protein C8Q77DRAFT_215189 [Trametes polyzona]|nr:hypothetical protein C8Q77DRAFT_215189 [Trametes polyzona]